MGSDRKYVFFCSKEKVQEYKKESHLLVHYADYCYAFMKNNFYVLVLVFTQESGGLT